MRVHVICLLAAGLLLAGGPVRAADAEAIDVEAMKAIEAEVADVERAFAQTFADRDFEAFKSFLDDEVVSWGNAHLRGKQAVADAWRGNFEGEQAPFAWKPETILVLPSGGLAYSTGPVWTPDGTVSAYYHSTWRKNDAGEWKLVFDKGQSYCPPTAE